MAFPESFIQELKMRNSITEVVAPYVSLKRNGRNMVGLCPFHGEKTPSFNIYDENTDNAHFYCFGCGVGCRHGLARNRLRRQHVTAAQADL